MVRSYEIPRAELQRIADIVLERSNAEVSASVKAAANDVQVLAFGSSWIGDVPCLGVAAYDYGRPQGFEFDGPAFDELVAAYLETDDSGIALVLS